MVKISEEEFTSLSKHTAAQGAEVIKTSEKDTCL